MGGRRLLIQEKRLVYRSQTNIGGQSNQKKVVETDSARCGKYPTQNGGVHFIKLEEELSPVTTTSSFCSWPDEVADTFSSTETPLARRFVEDEAREWRELDYTLEVRFEDVFTTITGIKWFFTSTKVKTGR